MPDFSGEQAHRSSLQTLAPLSPANALDLDHQLLPGGDNGLRIGNSRTGLGNMLPVDLAFPLVTQPCIDSVQLLVETRRSF